MTTAVLRRALCTLTALSAVYPLGGAAQVCTLADSTLALVPAEPPSLQGFDSAAPPPEPLFDLDLGVGHAYHAPLGDDVSPLFVRAGLPLAMHAEPAQTSSLVGMVSIDDGLEPHEIRGEWMRVTLVQPSDYCRPDVASTRRDGWVRWLTGDGRGPRLWYSTRGC